MRTPQIRSFFSMYFMASHPKDPPVEGDETVEQGGGDRDGGRHASDRQARGEGRLDRTDTARRRMKEPAAFAVR